MPSTKIFSCSCDHAVQDELYGPSNRVHNEAPKGKAGGLGWRCTVCGKVRSEGSGQGVELTRKAR